jgi:hypothetical protein
VENSGLEKAKVFRLAGAVEYVPKSIVVKTIVRKLTGHVSVVSFDSDESLSRISAFDTLIEILEGQAEVVISELSSLLTVGQSIIIPAHTSGTINARGRFKMLSTIIKSGYETM